MAITKLKGLRGEAEVLGELRAVAWDSQNGLVLYGLTLEEAERALNLLSSGKVVGVKLPEAQPRNESANVKPAQPDKFPSHAPVEEKTMVPLATKEQVKEAVAKPEPASLVNAGVLDQDEALKAAHALYEAKTAPAKSNGNGKLAETVKVTVNAEPLHAMTSLGEVVVYLYEKGVTTPDALVAECAVLKGQVPLLGRITNLEERVRRAYEVKGLGQPQ